MRVRNKKLFKIVIVLFFFVVVGYTALITTISMNGTTTIGANSWDVHFENLTLGSDNNVTGTQSITSNTSVNFTISLNEPGDKYSFTVDVVNEGSIDAMVNSLTKTSLTTAQEKLLDFNVTYSDGLAISQKDKLVKTSGSETIKVTVNYKTDVTAADLPSSAINLTLDVSLNYIQADSTANVVGHTLDDFITLAKSGVSLSSSYVGKEFTVNLGTTYGEHIIRVANISSPAECSGADFSQTACGVVLEFSDVISEHSMNSSGTNEGGWPSSEMRTYLNDDIYNSLPTNLKNSIINTKVISGSDGSVDGKSSSVANGPGGTWESEDKLYILDYDEIYGSGGATVDNYLRQLDYYYVNNVSYENKIPAIKPADAFSYVFWMRSTNSYCAFNYSKIVLGKSMTVIPNGYEEYSVSPAFRIA